MAWTHLFDSDDAFASNRIASIGSKSAPAGTANVSNNTTLATGVANLSAGTLLIDCTPAHSYTGSALETYAGLTKDSGTDQKVWYDGNSTTRRFAASSRLNFGTTRSMSEPSATHTGNATVQTRQVIALAWDTTGASLYRNGALIATNATANTAASGTATLKVGPLSDLVSALPVRTVALADHRLTNTELQALTADPSTTFYGSGGASFTGSGAWSVSGAAAFTTQAQLSGSGALSFGGAVGLATRSSLSGLGAWGVSGAASVTARARLSGAGSWGVSGSGAFSATAAAPAQLSTPATFEASGIWGYAGAASYRTQSRFAGAGAWAFGGSAVLGLPPTVVPSKTHTLAPVALTLAPVELTLAPVELRL